MKRIRLSTLVLLVIIAAQALALVTQSRRAARREAELLARIPPRIYSPLWEWTMTPQDPSLFVSPEDVVFGPGNSGSVGSIDRPSVTHETRPND